ncbi:hypothetical protein [Pyramidobacter porci]
MKKAPDIFISKTSGAFFFELGWFPSDIRRYAESFQFAQPSAEGEE